jgi:glycosyltransferase involved in cell wall biosynthesis
MKKPIIVAVHLLNDYSGSPRIFSHSLNVLHKDGYVVHLYTSRTTRGGFLSSVHVNKRYSFFYRWSPNKFLTLLAFLYCQTLLFFRMLKYINRPVIFYINTVLPFGVALAAKIMRKKVVYHVHETHIRPASLKKLLFGIVEHCATRVVYVSEFLKKQDPFVRPLGIVIQNSIDKAFLEKSATAIKRTVGDPAIILMICSLKRYKGVDEFLLLAQRNSSLRFELVMNADTEEIHDYFRHQYLPPNLSIFTMQEDVHDFYSRATVLVNLSRPDLFMETFGLTILEAQCYGIPSIVPPVGGVTELVTENITGYYADSRYIGNVEKCLQQLLSDEGPYQRMSAKARENSLKMCFLKFLHPYLPLIL